MDSEDQQSTCKLSVQQGQWLWPDLTKGTEVLLPILWAPLGTAAAAVGHHCGNAAWGLIQVGAHSLIISGLESIGIKAELLRIHPLVPRGAILNDSWGAVVLTKAVYPLIQGSKTVRQLVFLCRNFYVILQWRTFARVGFWDRDDWSFQGMVLGPLHVANGADLWSDLNENGKELKGTKNGKQEFSSVLYWRRIQREGLHRQEAVHGWLHRAKDGGGWITATLFCRLEDTKSAKVWEKWEISM